MSYTLYFDRSYGTINGAVTLQKVENGKIIPIFKRLPAASGQSGYTGRGDDWLRGKGPIPMGRHWLSTKKEPLQQSPVGSPFYVIGSEKGSRLIINPANPTLFRDSCGLHFDNLWRGSLGCIAMSVDNTAMKERAQLLFDHLDFLNTTGIDYIRVVVL